MAPPLNRSAIFLNLAAFFGVGVFCISTDAPIIQQDIKERCQDTLLLHRISIKGLDVDGRDVILTGAPESALLSPPARSAVAAVRGVRAVLTRVLPAGPAPASDIGANESTSPQTPNPLLQQEVQRKIDRVLENQGISFKADTTALTPQSELALDQIATYLAQAPSLLCEIRGYDIQLPEAGEAEAGQNNLQQRDLHQIETRQNWVLALQRALAAEDYLEGKGIADWRLSTRAYHVGEGTEGRRTDRPLDLVVRTRE